MRSPGGYHQLNYYNRGLWNNMPAYLLLYIPRSSKRSCITSIQQSSNQFSQLCHKESSSFMPATFVVRLSNQILVPIVALCLFAYICGVAVIIASVFSHLNSKSIISVSHHRSKQFYGYISSFVSYRYFNLTKVTHKENHFVPKTFLKSWAIRDGKNFLVNTLSLNDNCQRKQPTSSIAKKKNLYTLPSDFQTNHHKIVEHIILKYGRIDGPVFYLD